MIRDAKFEDIPRCIEMLATANRRSVYASIGSVDELRARDLLVSMVSRMMSAGEERTFYKVAQKSGAVEGFLIAVQQSVYHVGDINQATDIYTLLSTKADPGDFLKLLNAYKEWAWRQNVVEIQAGVTDIMGKDWETRLCPIYERLGFERCGAIYRMWRPSA